MNRRECSVSSNRNKKVGGEAGNAISKLCASQATKNGSANCSAEPLRAHWDEEMENKRNIEAKHVWIHSNSKLKLKMKWQKCSSVQTETKFLVVS